MNKIADSHKPMLIESKQKILFNERKKNCDIDYSAACFVIVIETFPLAASVNNL